jgi:hypothetical protein
MLEELTIEYNMENYLEVVKNCNMITYSLEGYGEVPSTINIRDSLQNTWISLIRKKSHEDLSEGWSRLAKM